MTPLISSRGQRLEELRQHAPTVAAGLILALALIDLVHLAVAARDAAVGAQLPLVPKLMQMEPAPHPAPGTIIAAHLFGAAPAAEGEGPNEAAPALWVLNGIIATGDGGEGYALIARKGEPDRVWHTGEPAQPGRGRLVRVFRDHVLIRVAGDLRTLSLQRKRSGGSMTMTAAVTPIEEVDGSTAHMADRSSDLPPMPTLAQSWLARLRPFAQADRDGGGLLVHVPGKHHRYGFEDGDVVTAINGHPVSDANSTSQWLSQVSNGPLSVSVSRNGHPETVTVDVGN